MLIILEGTDLSGKTTLAEQLRGEIQRRFPNHTVRVLHKGPPKSHPLSEYVTPLLNYFPELDHVICDRWHLGEIVYPALLGRKTLMTPGITRYIEAFLQRKGAIIVHTHVSPMTLEQRFHQRGDDSRTLEEVHTADALFKVEVGRTLLTTTTTRNVVDIVDLAIRRAAFSQSSKSRGIITYVGHPEPDVLYVGDKRVCPGGLVCLHNQQHSALGTAFMPYPATSGDFLMRNLPKTWAWGLMNVCDVDRGHTVKTFIKSVPYVVALGREAQKWLTIQGFKHTAVPHPQYVRRFHNAAGDVYRELLNMRDGGDHIPWRS